MNTTTTLHGMHIWHRLRNARASKHALAACYATCGTEHSICQPLGQAYYEAARLAVHYARVFAVMNGQRGR